MSGLLTNTTGIIFSFGALAHAATLVFPSSREIHNWPSQIDRYEITHIMLRPVALQYFVEGAIFQNAHLTSLRIVAYGAASLGVSLLEQARQLMPCQWIQGYGLSETFGPFCWLDEADHYAARYRKSIYCIGKPDDTLEVKIDQGELIVRGKSLMQGYYLLLDDQVIATDEWFRTGDYAEQSEDGYFNLRGRVSTTVLSRNGHRIYPEEIESIIKQIKQVEDALLVTLHRDVPANSDPVICIQGPLVERSSTEICGVSQILCS